MLDIGEGTGALVVYTSAELAGQEIEIRPHRGTWAGVHTAVRPRHLGDTVLHAGVFGSLSIGRYDIRLRRSHDRHSHHGHSHHGHSRAGPVTGTTSTVPGSVQSVVVRSGGVAETRLVETPGG
jgi:hypothetical protein